MKNDLHQEILRMYEEVDQEVAQAGPVCESSGKCCRFREYGHVLYLTSLEAQVLLASAPAFTRPVSKDYCPFQIENLCTARAPRPLGCRIYYCDPAYQDKSHKIMEKYLARLKSIAQSRKLEWLYAPLHFFLNQHDEGGSASENNLVEHAPSARFELPVLNEI